MSESLPVRKVDAPLALQAELTPDQLVERMGIIQSAMTKCMKQDADYGIIPGCKKPSLLQPGAEKLCALFHLAPTYAFTKEWRPEMERPWEKEYFDRYAKKKVKKTGVCKGFIRYECECTLIHGPSGIIVAGGTGVANNWEPKFVSRDPYEAEETVKQFARKRAMVNAVRTGTAASALFTQDIEDMSLDGLNEERGGEPAKPAAKSPTAKAAEKAFSAEAKPKATPAPGSGAPAPEWHDKPLGFGKNKDKTWGDVERGYLEWIVENVPPDPKYTPDRNTMASGELAYRDGQPAADPPTTTELQDTLSDNDVPF